MTGGSLAIRGGFRQARNSAIMCGIFLAVIEGVGIGFQRMMADSTRLDVSITSEPLYVSSELAPHFLRLLNGILMVLPCSTDPASAASTVRLGKILSSHACMISDIFLLLPLLSSGGIFFPTLIALSPSRD